jgi:hypothetical protein
LPFKADFNIGVVDAPGEERELCPPPVEDFEIILLLGETVTLGGAKVAFEGLDAFVEDETSLWLLEDFLLLFFDLLESFELFDLRRS